MKKVRQAGIPAFLASMLFLSAELIDDAWEISGYQYRIGIIFNILMIMIAILGFFYVGLPARNTLEGVSANVAVSLIAFPMNVSMFGNEIQIESFWKDFWGWHLWWVICMVIQILSLTRLGNEVLKWIRKPLKKREREEENAAECKLADSEDAKRGSIKASTALLFLATAFFVVPISLLLVSVFFFYRKGTPPDLMDWISFLNTMEQEAEALLKLLWYAG